MLTPARKASLSALFPNEKVYTNPASLIAYEQDAGSLTGLPEAVVLPASAEEIQRLVYWAAENNIPLTARGAGTGLTGGAVTPQGGILVGLVRLNALLQVDEINRQAVVQPGLINQELQRKLKAHNLIYPPDPASHAVSTIGGNIAENAGGPHCLKYGVTANYVQALEVILADGRCLGLGSLANDPPEYDFVSLITGSEGTLALISQAVLRLRRPAAGVKTLTASFAQVAIAGQAVSAIIAAGLTPATIELMDHNMINIVEDYLGLGLLRQAAALLIFDFEGYPESLDEQLDNVIRVLERYEPLELKIARTPQERERLWLGRRNASGAVARISPSEYVLDVSVPRSCLGEAIEHMNAIAARYGFPIAYLGHAGDGNLHPGLLCDLSRPADRQGVHQAGDEILRYCAEIGGSIGGEHGIGIEKRAYMDTMYSAAELAAMLEVKQVFDPQNLLNPGKIFPSQALEFTLPAQGRLPSMGRFAPSSPDEVAQVLRALQAANSITRVSGAREQWHGSAPQGMTLETTRLNQVLKLSSDDFYVTAQAGITLQELGAALGEHGFRLAAASPWTGGTLGGLVSTNLNSPLRLLYGGLRDQVLALQVALADGRLLRFGRPLVKDVAGYQMNKLFCGAFGSLGVLTELTLKIVSQPLASQTLLVGVEGTQQALQAAYTALRVAVISSGILLVPGSKLLPNSNLALLISLEGHPADVRAEVYALRQALSHIPGLEIEQVEAPSATQIWAGSLSNQPLVIRAGLLPSGLAGFLSAIDLPGMDEEWVLDVANGLFWLAVHSSLPRQIEARLSQLRGAAQASQGYALLARAPRTLLDEVDAWGPPRPSQELMRALKLCWDTMDILNRGEFI